MLQLHLKSNENSVNPIADMFINSENGSIGIEVLVPAKDPGVFRQFDFHVSPEEWEQIKTFVDDGLQKTSDEPTPITTKKAKKKVMFDEDEDEY